MLTEGRSGQSTRQRSWPVQSGSCALAQSINKRNYWHSSGPAQCAVPFWSWAVHFMLTGGRSGQSTRQRSWPVQSGSCALAQSINKRNYWRSSGPAQRAVYFSSWVYILFPMKVVRYSELVSGRDFSSVWKLGASTVCCSFLKLGSAFHAHGRYCRSGHSTRQWSCFSSVGKQRSSTVC